MVGVEEARNIILKNTNELNYEIIEISSALNRVLSEDIYAAENIPPFNNSAMDGYAVVSSMLKGSSYKHPSTLRIIGNLPAGYTSENIINEDMAMKIMTGAPVPEGADAVVPIEFTKVEGNVVKISKEAIKWENIRFAGEDVKKGQLVISRGKVIRPAEIGMLAALNIDSVKVAKTPKISILATGDEIVNLGEELLPGKIRNINSYSLYAQVLKHGCNPMDLGIARDSREEIREKLEMGKDSDILIISGGVSVGDYDHVKNVLNEMGMEEKFWRIAIKPGKPVLFGVMGNTLVFGLPGNPVSSMVAFEQFVLPAIYRMQGRKKKTWNEVNAILEGNIEKKSGLMYFLRGKTVLKNGRIYVKPTDSQSSGAFSSMVLADCLIVIPKGVKEVKSGDEVLIQITDEIGE